LSAGLESWKRPGNEVENRESYFLEWFTMSVCQLAARR
jgi:hypothetical protein